MTKDFKTSHTIREKLLCSKSNTLNNDIGFKTTAMDYILTWVNQQNHSPRFIIHRISLGNP